jgi:hypothetical protein
MSNIQITKVYVEVSHCAIGPHRRRADEEERFEEAQEEGSGGCGVLTTTGCRQVLSLLLASTFGISASFSCFVMLISARSCPFAVRTQLFGGW